MGYTSMNKSSYQIIQHTLAITESTPEESGSIASLWPTIRKSLEEWEDRHISEYRFPGDISGGIIIIGRYLLGNLTCDGHAISGNLYSNATFKALGRQGDNPCPTEQSFIRYLRDNVLLTLVMEELRRLENMPFYEEIGKLVYYDGPLNVSNTQDILQDLDVEFNPPSPKYFYSGTLALRTRFVMPVQRIS